MKRSTLRQPGREWQDLVIVDAVKLRWQIRRASKSVASFANKYDISRNSLYRMLDETAVRRETVARLAEQLEVATEELLKSTPVIASSEERMSPWVHPEWEVIPGTQLLHRPMSNGLVMQVAQVRHRLIENEWGRAKVYDISGMPVAVRDQCRHALSRHASVSRRVGPHRHIAENLTMTALRDESLWTAVDRWFEARTLTDLMNEGPLPRGRVGPILQDIASACATLHAHNIVLRELHPDHILVRVDDGRCVVTDLELAKLLEVEATVSSRWQPNPYRAAEVAGGQSHPQADLYSLARLMIHLLSGTLPEFPNDREWLGKQFPASPARRILESCLSPNWSKRPKSIEVVQQALAQTLSEVSHE